MDPTSIFLSLIFGSIGVGFFIYGKKQRRFLFLLVGLGLMFYPYFVPEVALLVVVGLILLSIPILAKRFF